MRVWLPPPVYTRARARTHTHTHTHSRRAKIERMPPPRPRPRPRPSPEHTPAPRQQTRRRRRRRRRRRHLLGLIVGRVREGAGSLRLRAWVTVSFSPRGRGAGAGAGLRGDGTQVSWSRTLPTYPPNEPRRTRRRRRRRWAPCCAGAPARRGTGGRRACAPPWPGARRRACRVSGEGRGGAGGRRDLEVGDELHDFGVALDGALLLPCPLLCVLLHDPGKSIFIQFQGLVLLLDDDLLHPFCPLADSLCRGIVSAAGAVTDRSQRRNFSWSYLGTSLNLLCFTSAAFMAASFASLYQ